MNSPARVYSSQQHTIFDALLSGLGNIVVVARAGAGKTSTSVEGIRRLVAKYPALKILVCAFNKSIQTEIAGRLPKGVDCKTFHGLSYGSLRSNWGSSTRPADKRAVEIVREALPRDPYPEHVSGVKKLVGLAMNTMTTSDDDLANLMFAFDCAPPPDVSLEKWLEWTRRALEIARVPSPEISFDQMVYVPAFHGWKTGNYDLVLVDELQDMNACQLVLARNALKPTGRFVGVGDPRQAIYAFRGATANAMARTRDEFGAVELKLTVTYRCARAVVAEANAIVPDLEAAPGAPEGSVTHASEGEFLRNVRGGDFVLSRRNAPLVVYCLRMLVAGRPAYIQGRDIGAGLVAMVRKPRRHDLNDYLSYLHNWKSSEVKRLIAADREEAIEELSDKVDAIVALSEGLTTTDGLVGRITSLFEEGDADGRIMFSSVHKAKGMEASRVWCLKNTFKPGRSEEEDNLCYVAITRAQEALVFVNAPPKERK